MPTLGESGFRLLQERIFKSPRTQGCARFISERKTFDMRQAYMTSAKSTSRRELPSESATRKENASIATAIQVSLIDEANYQEKYCFNTIDQLMNCLRWITWLLCFYGPMRLTSFQQSESINSRKTTFTATGPHTRTGN
ncbi:hypothetical protein JTE90_024734 [Oedothorax gibbosus]|uniref:Uncharacterized protein n=1 Tax=Oedothorax gibbosus TaxID=931172 RepID=A0AAV6UBI1_9ARAC|nr:hypothetical protein JTE90_024734 [Oedothorax gibbosus]